MTRPGSHDLFYGAGESPAGDSYRSETGEGAKGADAEEELADELRGFVGDHPAMRELAENIGKLAGLPAPVLVLGESGTGKELVARALHDLSRRREERFLAVNCGAIPRHLLESELFGHRRGAFTGAHRDRRGYFVAAGGGTLFLDEIAELDLDLQVKLLRSLQDGEVTPLGSNTPEPWSARLVCATNIDIDRAVSEGLFRRDLYYRINVMRIEVPPLRERRSDIPLLVDWFLAKHTRRKKTISGSALEALEEYEWPGNVRQLENAIIRAHALAPGDVVRIDDLPGEISRRGSAGRGNSKFPTLDELNRQHLIRALRLTRGVRTAAARLLEIDRNRLARMIKRYGIDVEGIAGCSDDGRSEDEREAGRLPRGGPSIQ